MSNEITKTYLKEIGFKGKQVTLKRVTTNPQLLGMLFSWATTYEGFVFWREAEKTKTLSGEALDIVKEMYKVMK